MAFKLFKTKFWEELNFRQRTHFQLFTDKLCMPFDIFHEAIEKSLGRPVYTSEFELNYDSLCKEFLGEKNAPTIQEIIEMIPEEKRLVLKQKDVK